jgi:hypothetical protein
MLIGAVGEPSPIGMSLDSYRDVSAGFGLTCHSFAPPQTGFAARKTTMMNPYLPASRISAMVITKSFLFVPPE